MAEDVADAVERQVRAYNARDLDGFLACFAEEVDRPRALPALRLGACEASAEP